MDDSLRQEVLDTYGAYVKAFRDNDVPALDKLIQYPLAYIGAGRTTLVSTFPVQPADLMAAKQWHDTKDLDPEVVFVTQDKAHVIVRRATRLRADGSPIEVVSAFYALTRTAAGWRFFAFSDITVPISQV
jgi:hypothetical protein